MDPGALGDGVALEVEVLGEGLADEEDAGRVQAHGLLQAGLQVGQLGKVPRGECLRAIRIQLLQQLPEVFTPGLLRAVSCGCRCLPHHHPDQQVVQVLIKSVVSACSN